MELWKAGSVGINSVRTEGTVPFVPVNVRGFFLSTAGSFGTGAGVPTCTYLRRKVKYYTRVEMYTVVHST